MVVHVPTFFPAGFLSGSVDRWCEDLVYFKSANDRVVSDQVDGLENRAFRWLVIQNCSMVGIFPSLFLGLLVIFIDAVKLVNSNQYKGTPDDYFHKLLDCMSKGNVVGGVITIGLIVVGVCFKSVFFLSIKGAFLLDSNGRLDVSRTQKPGPRNI